MCRTRPFLITKELQPRERLASVSESGSGYALHTVDQQADCFDQSLSVQWISRIDLVVAELNGEAREVDQAPKIIDILAVRLQGSQSLGKIMAKRIGGSEDRKPCLQCLFNGLLGMESEDVVIELTGIAHVDERQEIGTRSPQQSRGIIPMDCHKSPFLP